ICAVIEPAHSVPLLAFWNGNRFVRIRRFDRHKPASVTTFAVHIRNISSSSTTKTVDTERGWGKDMTN
ncbi:MAG: hypothetical protein WAN01_18110, partial [Bradyrhizobium sp.]